MGLFSTMRRRRQEKKATIKAAKVRAIAETKADAKLEKAKEKYLRKTAKKVRKADAKELKNRRKHEEKMASAALQQLKAGNFNSQNVSRYVGAARVALPALLPLFYRGMTQMKEVNERQNLQRAGLVPTANASFAGDGPTQQARIRQIRKDVSKGGVPMGFAKDVEERMDDLEDAVNNTSTMNNDQTRHVLQAISRELDLVESQIRTKRS